MNKLLAKAKIMKEKPLQLEDYTTKWTYFEYINNEENPQQYHINLIN